MSERINNKILHALRRYFSGNKSEEGENIYNKWFQSFEDPKVYLDRLSEAERQQYKDNAFHSLQKKLNHTDTVTPIQLNKKHPGKRSVFYRVAAILMIGTMLSLAGVYLSGVTEPEEIPVVMIERSNPVGQISEITLPDGSTVWLGAASSLEYPETFSEEARSVQLNGQAFFDVVSDPGKPFTVESGPLFTTVLGTSFNVRAYHDDPNMEVTLATGKVEVTVNDNGQKQKLEPNQRVRFDSENGLGETESVDASLANSWTQRELVFIRESFETIARTFERWYGIEFVFEDETLKEETFVYHFKELSLQNSMIVLNELAEFDYEIDNNKVFVRRSTE